MNAIQKYNNEASNFIQDLIKDFDKENFKTTSGYGYVDSDLEYILNLTFYHNSVSNEKLEVQPTVIKATSQLKQDHDSLPNQSIIPKLKSDFKHAQQVFDKYQNNYIVKAE